MVEQFKGDDKALKLEGARRTKTIPCPAETRGTVCSACRLCLRPDALMKTNAAIAFKIHGQGAGRALAALRRRDAAERGQRLARPLYSNEHLNVLVPGAIQATT